MTKRWPPVSDTTDYPSSAVVRGLRATIVSLKADVARLTLDLAEARKALEAAEGERRGHGSRARAALHEGKAGE